MESGSRKTQPLPIRTIFRYFAPEKTSFAVLVLSFLSLLFTYPTIVQLSTHLIGGTADGWQFPWNNYIFRERILQGQDPYFTDYVFYPVGVSLILHGYTEFNNVIGLILSPFFNDVAVTNLMVILATFLSGFGAYLLTRELTGSPLAGLFAGIAFAFCPFRMIRIIGHIHMALTQFLPLAIWAMLKMARTQKIRYAILTGLFFALACYCNYYYVIYLLIAFLLMVVYGTIRYADWRTISFFRNLVLSGAVAVVLLLPVAYHTYLLLKGGTAESYSGEEAFYVKNAADIWDYLRIAPLNQAVLQIFGESPLIWPYSRVTPGFTVLLLFLPGLVYVVLKRPHYFGILLFTGLGFFLLSLGPVWETKAFRIPLPYSLISKIPILSHVRVPDRFGIIVNLMMAVIAGYMLAYLSAKLSGARRKALCFGAFSLLLFELATIPFPMESFDPPMIFYQLAENKGNAMLSLPFFPGNIRAKQYMRFQSVHHQKLLDGRVSRNPWLPIKYVKGLPITKTFHGMTIGTIPAQDVIETDRTVAPLFRELFHVRTVALFPPFSYHQENRNYVQSVFPDAKLLSDEKGILVYSLPQNELRTFQYNRENEEILFFLIENWQLDRRGFQILCRQSQAKLLLPDVGADEVMVLKLTMRATKLRSGKMKLHLKIGNSLIAEKDLKSNFQLWRMEIPGDILKKEGRIAQIDIDKTHTDSAAEIHEIEVKLLRR